MRACVRCVCVCAYHGMCMWCVCVHCVLLARLHVCDEYLHSYVPVVVLPCQLLINHSLECTMYIQTFTVKEITQKITVLARKVTGNKVTKIQRFGLCIHEHHNIF